MDPSKTILICSRTSRSFSQRQPAQNFDCLVPSALNLGNSTPSGPSSPSFGVNVFRETSMDLGSGGGAVLFSVNPPSPLESDYCSDDQESILKTWHTDGTSNSKDLGTGWAHHAQGSIIFAPTLMDHGTRLSSSARAASSQPATTKLPKSSAKTPLTSSANLGKGSKRAQNRRSSAGEANRRTELYKTEMCISVSSGVPCRYGDNCQFAHSAQELNHVHRHPRYKTQLCTSFQSQGYCKYNDRCTFIHHLDEARIPLSPSIFRAGRSTNTTRSSSSSDSASASRVATPISSSKREQKSSERLRASSDPGIVYVGHSTGTTIDTVELTLNDNTKPNLAHLPTMCTPQTAPVPEIQNTLLSGGIQSSWASCLQDTCGVPFGHASEPFQERDTGLQFSHQASHVDFAPSSYYYTLSNVMRLTGSRPEHTAYPLATASTIGPSSVLQRTTAFTDGFQDSVDMDTEVDMEWYSSLGHFISTPQNEFTI
ncbi:hypothetical protein BGX28_001220 [Mortierella sp. GBA30]|nr:hypothetical protein BGX28_001220 [Mortierella sp. GBA30]